LGWFLDLLQNVPVWFAGVIVASVGLAVSQAGVGLVARLVSVERRRRVNDVIALLLSVTAVIYAVPLALIAGEAWGDFTEARAAAAREAGAVARTAASAALLPTELARRVEAGLASYASTVIDQDWSEMKHGGRPRAAERPLAELRALLAAAADHDTAAAGAIERTMSRLDALTAGRADRILAIGEGLIGAIWWLIGVGGAITLLLCATYAIEDIALHRVLCGLVALTITSVVLLIVATDRPFHGVPRVPPDAMREVLELDLAPTQQ
jgi:hypothetical protein